MACLGSTDYEQIDSLVARDLFEGTIAMCLLEVTGEAQRHGIDVPAVVTQWKEDLERLRAVGKKMPGRHPFESSDCIPTMDEESQYVYPEGWMQRMVRIYRHSSLGASLLCGMCRRLAGNALLDQCSAVTRHWWKEHCVADREKGVSNEAPSDLKGEAARYPEVLSLYIAMCDSNLESTSANEESLEREHVDEPRVETHRRPVGAVRVLGVDPSSGRRISVRVGRYGPFVQAGTKDDGEKPMFAGLAPSQSMDTITLKDALALFELPADPN